MISETAVKIFEYAKAREWFTSKDMAAALLLARRTANWHLRKMTYAGVLERCKRFGGCAYKLAPNLGDDAYAYLNELELISETFKRKAKPTLAKRLAAFFRPKDKRAPHEKTEDEHRLSLTMQLAQLAHQARANPGDYRELVTSDLEDAWRYLREQRAA